jgi:hypothetical protein
LSGIFLEPIEEKRRLQAGEHQRRAPARRRTKCSQDRHFVKAKTMDLQKSWSVAEPSMALPAQPPMISLRPFLAGPPCRPTGLSGSRENIQINQLFMHEGRADPPAHCPGLRRRTAALKALPASVATAAAWQPT